MQPVKVLVVGASYGSLLASKLLMAGHSVTLVGRTEEAALINERGTLVRMPIRGHDGLTTVESRSLPGVLSAAVPLAVDPSQYDLAVLAIQEPQAASSGLRELLEALGKAGTPCMSIMNMPPLPYLARLPGVDVDACRYCYTDPTVWDHLDPHLMTLCSPDPQAFRPPDEPDNILQVRLPTNFKAARFESADHTAILRRLEADIAASRLPTDEGEIELPVKLRVHESVFVPLAKWSMLIAGNYRCIQENGVRSIKDAVHSDVDAARSMYTWVADLCKALGAVEEDLVPFEKYARAAEGLTSPSSAARAVAGGAPEIERVDLLVKTLAAQKGMQSAEIDDIVDLVDGHLEENRKRTRR